MSEDIQFQDIVMNRMEIKVGRFPLRILIIRWVLDRGEIIDIHIVGNNDDPPRVLTSRPFDACGTFCQAIDFGCSIMKIMIALKAFYETKGCFVGYGTDRSCTIDVFFTEEYFRIVMGFWLIFS